MARAHRALVVASVDEPAAELPPADLIVAADGGADVVLAAGRIVDILVGDMDSITSAALATVTDQGGRVVEHPPDKDQTDLELALEIAVEAAAHVHVIAAAGGRLDHATANLAVLASPRWARATVEATIGPNRVWVVRDRVTIAGSAGEIVSLLPMGGPVAGVRTAGLRYELEGESLDPLAARGVSNVMTGTTAEISIESGSLLVVKPPGP